MYEPNIRQPAGLLTDTLDPGGQLHTIRMRAVAIDHHYMGAEWYLVTEYGQHGTTFDYPTTKSMLSLKAHDQYGVSRV